MSLTPAMITTTFGFEATTSWTKRAPIWSLRSPLTPRLSTRHSGCVFISQYAYWLSTLPDPFGGASIGDLNPGVPAVVESPSATMVTGSTDQGYRPSIRLLMYFSIFVYP